MPPADTKEHILDAAEQLIAEKGIDAVSLREITSTANVNLAAVHYHFGSKDALVQTVFARRIQPLNEQRLQMLSEVEAAAGDGPLAIEDVLRALITPAIRLYQADETGRRFMRVCGRIYSEPSQALSDVFDELFKHLVERFAQAFERALPGASKADRAWGMHFTVGMMVHTMLESERLKRFTNGMCDPGDSDCAIEQMVRFCAAGLRSATGAEAENRGSLVEAAR